MKNFILSKRKMVFLLSSTLLGFSFVSVADIYKHVDSEGRLIKYSDQPQNAGDKPISISKPAVEKHEEQGVTKSSTTPNIPRRKEKPVQTESKPVAAYFAVAIMKPENEEAIRANSGSFPIQLVSQPVLDSGAGHRYVVVVDGEKHQESTSADITLENMDRGAHSIKAEIWDKNDSVMVSSSSITIYVLRAIKH